MHQPMFSGDAEIQFKRWNRAQRIFEFKRAKKVGKRACKFWLLFVFFLLKDGLFDFLVGYGHRPFRFVSVSIVILMIIAAFVHEFWPLLGLAKDSQLLAQGSYLTSLYYTTVVTTTLGFGDITPTTGWGQLAAIILSILGVVWFALLAAVLIKRIIK